MLDPTEKSQPPKSAWTRPSWEKVTEELLSRVGGLGLAGFFRQQKKKKNQTREKQRGLFSQSLRGQKDLGEASAASEVKSNRAGGRDLYFFCLVSLHRCSSIRPVPAGVLLTVCAQGVVERIQTVCKQGAA